MIKQLGTVAVYVEDQQEAKKFWTEQVGFAVAAERSMGPGGFWLEVAPEGQNTRIVIYPRAMMNNWAELKPSIVFECEDMQKTYSEMSARGVKFLQEPKVMDWGSFARFQDPDGNEFLLKG